MIDIYKQIQNSKLKNQKLLAILLDPDKIDFNNLEIIVDKINQSPANFIFIGGSIVVSNVMDAVISKIKKNSNLPIILFPGNPSQISNKADAILFLSLISGRNPDFLIGHQVSAAPILKQTNLEIIATGYILIESGTKTAVERVSKTNPIHRIDCKLVVATAQAGEMLGHKLVYLEAGSGAKQAVPPEMIKEVAQNIKIPLIVGGGIRALNEIHQAFDAGADVVVVGTAFENNIDFFCQNK